MEEAILFFVDLVRCKTQKSALERPVEYGSGDINFVALVTVSKSADCCNSGGRRQEVVVEIGNVSSFQVKFKVKVRSLSPRRKNKVMCADSKDWYS